MPDRRSGEETLSAAKVTVTTLAAVAPSRSEPDTPSLAQRFEAGERRGDDDAHLGLSGVGLPTCCWLFADRSKLAREAVALFGCN